MESIRSSKTASTFVANLADVYLKGMPNLATKSSE